MKKGIIVRLAGAALMFSATTATAYDRVSSIPHESHYSPVRYSTLAYRVSKMNRTLSHVRWQARARGAGWHVRHT